MKLTKKEKNELASLAIHEIKKVRKDLTMKDIKSIMSRAYTLCRKLLNGKEV